MGVDGHYSRERRREGPVSLSTRIFYSVGALPEILKEISFTTFGLFFYNQILGLPGVYAATALMIALVVDAISDPLVGSFSDSFRSRFGRRHPFMLGAAVPLGLSLYLLFSPPAGFDHIGYFIWLTVFAVASRLSITFFQVPWMALFSELSEDYDERTAIMKWRILFGFLGGTLFIYGVLTFIFPATAEYPFGQLNPSAYNTYAVAVAALVIISILTTVFFTRKEVPYLLTPTADAPKYQLLQVFGEVWQALQNRNFRVLFVSTLVGSAVFGTYKSMEFFVSTYFWGLTTEHLRWMILIVPISSIIVFVLAGPLQRIFDKKQIIIGGLCFMALDGIVMISLRLIGVLPENGTIFLLGILTANLIVRSVGASLLALMTLSMLADVIDEIELQTTRRREGVASASFTFAQKVTTGVGTLISGLLLQYVIRFPVNASPAIVDPDAIIRLGVIAGAAVPALYIFGMLITWNYDLSRKRHAQVRDGLAAVGTKTAVNTAKP